MPCLHVPAQSGSDRDVRPSLRQAARPGLLPRYDRASARSARQDMAFSSDFIVGFPGESDDEFPKATLSLVDEIGYAGAYSFKYSARPGTPAAADMPDQICESLKSERLHRLQAAIDRTSSAFNARCVGRTFDVLFEKPGRHPGQIVGRTPYLQPVQVTACASWIGKVAAVTIAEMSSNSLYGVLAREAQAVETDTVALVSNRQRINRDLAKTTDGNAANSLVLAFDDNRLASMLFGQYGQNLALIERRLGVVAEQRGNHVSIADSATVWSRRGACSKAFTNEFRHGDELVSGDVEGAIRLAIAQGSLFDYDATTARASFEEIQLRKRPVRARTAAQDAYIRALRRYALVFGIGPAGTGKTWLAVAHAVQLFERKEVDRIILSRPAVEAGEQLGFLPGDISRRSTPICDRSRRTPRPHGCAHLERAHRQRPDRDRPARLHARADP